MNITKERFIAINKYVLFAAIFIYLIGVFTPVNYLQPALIFVFGRSTHLDVSPHYDHRNISGPSCKPSGQEQYLILRLNLNY